MSDWISLPLSDLPIASGKSINPFEFPDEEFELYSVPAHETGQPEFVKGGDIGSNKQLVSPGTVLLCKINPRINRTWIVGEAGSRRQIASTEWIAFDSCEEIDQRFLMYFMQQSDVRDYLAANASGVGGSLMRIKPATLKGVTFRMPGIRTQRKIVEKLEELLSDLEAGVAELKAVQRKLTQYRQSLLKAAVEGALTADWRAVHSKPHETGAELLKRIMVERRTRWEQKQLAKFAKQAKAPSLGWQAKYPEPAAPDLTNLPLLPKTWTWASLDQLSEIQGGIQKQPSRSPVANRYPFLRVANVARGELKLNEVHEIELFDGELERLALQKGDILIVEGNGSRTEIGRCALWDGSIENAVHQNHLIRARPVLVQGEFIEAWLNSMRGMERMAALAATTSGLYTLSVGKISRIPVPLPPVEEQGAIAGLLATAVAANAEQASATNHSLEQAAAQRRNILKSAFSGRLVPPDSSDEPPSALLIRIRSEREAREKSPKVPRVKQKEIMGMARKMIDVLTEAKDWIPAQEVFRLCGVADGASTDQIEVLYAELRALDKAGRVEVEAVTDARGRKLGDKLKLQVG